MNEEISYEGKPLTRNFEKMKLTKIGDMWLTEDQLPAKMRKKAIATRGAGKVNRWFFFSFFEQVVPVAQQNPLLSSGWLVRYLAKATN